MFKFKNIFLCLTMGKKLFLVVFGSLLFFLFSVTPNDVFGANCIPQSDTLPTGCTLESTQLTYCEGLYGELDSTPTCTYDSIPNWGVDIKNYYCHCNVQFLSYKCGSTYKGVYVADSASLRTDNSCMPHGYRLDSWYSNITKQQGTNLSACRAWCGMTTPTPTQAKVIVSGYVKNAKTGLPIAGARILVQKTDDKYGFCVGQHWGCSPDYVITNSAGKWTSSCIDNPMKSIFVKEVNNTAGYIDSSRYPDPAGATVWDKNTVCYQNVAGKTSIGPIVFYDQK